MNQKITEEHKLDGAGNPAGGKTSGLGIAIEWQSGPLGTGADRKEPNGAFVEGVIQAALGRLEFYQGSKFKCDENEKAIRNLKRALWVLSSRTRAREKRGVEGTLEV